MSNQEVETPTILVDQIREFFGIKEFYYDLAATSENSKGINYYDKEIDSLSIDWPCSPYLGSQWLWLNQPFRNLTKFIDKCLFERDRGCKIITIWPISSDKNMLKVWETCRVGVVHGRVWPQVRGCMICQFASIFEPSVFGLNWDRKRLTYAWGPK